jgi:hypothetical protein
MKMTVPDCCLQGHAFTSRFSTIAPSPKQLEAACIDEWSEESSTINIIATLTHKTYMCDICEKCGLTVGIPAFPPDDKLVDNITN